MSLKQRMRVLIVDDNQEDREVLKRLLNKVRSTNFSVTEAEIGEEGLALACVERPDCIVLDYSLPDLDGVEFLAEIANKGVEAAVIMLTGQGNEAVAVDALKRGAKDYLVKSDLTPDSLEEAIKEAVERFELEQDTKVKSDELQRFARVAAHDLKAPLRQVKVFCELLQQRCQGRLDAKADTYLDHIVSSTRAMTTLVDDLLMYASSGAQSVPHALVDLNEVLSEVLSNLSEMIHEANAWVDVQQDLPRVNAYRTGLVQVLQNLVANAIKYCSDERPSVSVSSARDGDMFRISVRDNGIGIAPEDADKIFQPLTRLQQIDREGTGIGLATAKRIVERHGGTISVESAAGLGSTFHFTLPSSDERTTA